MILAFVLGPLLEENLQRALVLSNGDATTFLTNPISALFLAIALALVVLITFPSLKRVREEALQDTGP